MRHTKNVLAVAVVSLFSTYSMSALASPDCLNGDNTVCIKEEAVSFNVPFGGQVNGVEYTITNNIKERIFAFGVTNFSDDQNAAASAGAMGWNAAYIHKDDWNDGLVDPFNFFSPQQMPFAAQEQPLNEKLVVEVEWQGPFGPSMTWLAGEAPAPQQFHEYEIPNGRDFIKQPFVEAVYLGSFESLFGTEDDYVSFFWNEFTPQNPLTNGVEMDNNFLLFAPLASDHSTFGVNGNVLTTSVNAVPEPETYAMFLAGLGLLAFARRKH